MRRCRWLAGYGPRAFPCRWSVAEVRHERGADPVRRGPIENARTLRQQLLYKLFILVTVEALGHLHGDKATSERGAVVPEAEKFIRKENYPRGQLPFPILNVFRLMFCGSSPLVFFRRSVIVAIRFRSMPSTLASENTPTFFPIQFSIPNGRRSSAASSRDSLPARSIPE